MTAWDHCFIFLFSFHALKERKYFLVSFNCKIIEQFIRTYKYPLALYSNMSRTDMSKYL